MKKFILICSWVVCLFANAADNNALDNGLSWLQLIDHGDFRQSWQNASPLFKAQVTDSQWAGALEKVRTPLGDIVTREVKGTQSHKALPGAPDGEYVVITYKTQFENKRAATETLTLVRAEDTWRAVGYFIN